MIKSFSTGSICSWHILRLHFITLLSELLFPCSLVRHLSSLHLLLVLEEVLRIES